MISKGKLGATTQTQIIIPNMLIMIVQTWVFWIICNNPMNGTMIKNAKPAEIPIHTPADTDKALLPLKPKNGENAIPVTGATTIIVTTAMFWFSILEK